MSTGLQTQVKDTSVRRPSFTTVRSRLLQRRSTNQAESTTMPPIVHDVPRSPGQPLAQATRTFMESRFGRDFSRVPVRTPAPAVVQPKLTIGQPDDKYEQEADRVVKALMRMPEKRFVGRTLHPLFRSKKAGTKGSLLQTPSVQKAEEENQRAEAYEVRPDIAARIERQRGSGNPLEPEIRREMEVAFGRGLGHVRVHTSAGADQIAQELQAEAFTTGNEVFFRKGSYAQDSVENKELLAHELTHVVQETPGVIARMVSADYVKIKDNLSYGWTDWAITDEETHEVLVILSSLNPTDLVDTLNQMEKDDLVGPLLDNISDVDRRTYNSLFVSIWQSHVPPHPSLAVQAEGLGADTLTMDSYRQYQNKSRTWFFSPNDALDGRAGKPMEFATWDDWNKMHWQSKQVIADLAGLDAQRLGQTNSNLTRLKVAYVNWPASKYAVFQSGTSATNTCNVFLGDALFMDGKNQTEDGKYYSANDVYEATGRFTLIHSDALSRGDIAAWSFGHVEVVTSVDRANDEFCSRGGYREPMGGEICGVRGRQISNPQLRFLRIK
jgi:hypothetical protein